jgi:hypothetical protein
MYGTYPRKILFTADTDRCKVVISGVLFRGPEACHSEQQDTIEGQEELLCDPTGVTGYCDETGTLPQRPFQTRISLCPDHCAWTCVLTLEKMKGHAMTTVSKTAILYPNIAMGTPMQMHAPEYPVQRVMFTIRMLNDSQAYAYLSSKSVRIRAC